jgi:hypothetical protein
VAQAPGLNDEWFKSLISPQLNVHVVKASTYALLQHSKAALVTSGTATLETALLNVPQVVCYKGSPITYANWSTSAYNDFTFNATGIGNVSKTGFSKFGVRNPNYDVANTPPTWSSGVTSHMQCYFSDEAGTTSDPKLVVTYSLGGSAGSLLLLGIGT